MANREPSGIRNQPPKPADGPGGTDRLGSAAVPVAKFAATFPRTAAVGDRAMIGQQDQNELMKQVPRTLDDAFHVTPFTSEVIIRKQRGICPGAANNTCLLFLAGEGNGKCSRFVDLNTKSYLLAPCTYYRPVQTEDYTAQLKLAEGSGSSPFLAPSKPRTFRKLSSDTALFYPDTCKRIDSSTPQNRHTPLDGTRRSVDVAM